MGLRELPGRLWSRFRGTPAVQAPHHTSQYTEGLTDEYYTGEINGQSGTDIAREIMADNPHRRDQFLNDDRFLADDWSRVKYAIETDPELRHAFGLDGSPGTVHENSGLPYCEDHDCGMTEHEYKPGQDEMKRDASRIGGNANANTTLPGAGAGGQIDGQHERMNQSSETYGPRMRTVCKRTPKCRENLWGIYTAACNETDTEVDEGYTAGDLDRQFDPSSQHDTEHDGKSPKARYNELKNDNQDLVEITEKLEEDRQKLEDNRERYKKRNEKLRDEKLKHIGNNADLRAEEWEDGKDHTEKIEDHDDKIEKIEEEILDNSQRIKRIKKELSNCESELDENEQHITENEEEMTTIVANNPALDLGQKMPGTGSGTTTDAGTATADVSNTETDSSDTIDD